MCSRVFWEIILKIILSRNCTGSRKQTSLYERFTSLLPSSPKETFWLCPCKRVHEGINISFSLLRSHWSPLVSCRVLFVVLYRYTMTELMSILCNALDSLIYVGNARLHEPVWGFIIGMEFLASRRSERTKGLAEKPLFSQAKEKTCGATGFFFFFYLSLQRHDHRANKISCCSHRLARK